MNWTLKMMVGLPRSGKSNYARTLGFPIVNPDSIRVSLTGRKFYQPAEYMVWATAHLMVESLFRAGHNSVVLDATNTNFKRRDEWASPLWQREFHIISTPIPVCLGRATLACDYDMVNIIRRMEQGWQDVQEGEGKIVRVDWRGSVDEHLDPNIP